MKQQRKAIAALGAFALVALSACGESDPDDSSAETPAAGGEEAPASIRLSLNPGVYSFLPIGVAMERGYFEDENLDVEFTPIQGSSAELLPQLARGDLDIVPTVAAPGLFNAYAQGFDARLIANISETEEGWGETAWLMLPGDTCDSGSIEDLEDLAGLRIDAGPPGSPINFIARQAIDQAGLSFDDVTFTENYATPGDWLAALENDAVDVVSVVETAASALEAEGAACKWIPGSEVADWQQDAFFAANASFLEENPDVVVRFLRGFIHAAQDITEAGPEWTPELLQIAADFTGQPEDVLELTGGPEYSGGLGEIDLDYLERVQDFWVEAGLVEERVDVEDIVDTTALQEAD